MSSILNNKLWNSSQQNFYPWSGGNSAENGQFEMEVSAQCGIENALVLLPLLTFYTYKQLSAWILWLLCFISRSET